MDKQQAFNILYQAARQAPLNGDAHDVIKQAGQVLQAALTEKKEEKNEKLN
jgi:hypothetical protein